MKDETFINNSAQYLAVVKHYIETDSVAQAAKLANVSEVKARRILITEGLWSSEASLRVEHFLQEKLSPREIAEALHITEKAVQQYLPYSRGLYLDGEPSKAAHYSAEYRARIRIAQERVIRKRSELTTREGWEGEETMKSSDHFEAQKYKAQPVQHCIPEQYPGIVCLRELPEGMVDRDKTKCMGEDIIRLRLELIEGHYAFDHLDDDGNNPRTYPDEDDPETARVFRDYGEVKYGRTISRDLLVPGGLPLYALHYAIQAAFGWQNSHLHHFELPPRQYLRLTENRVKNWSQLVGVLFRSPDMDEDDRFWTDDYETGSFKNWLRKKYTGPYLSFCHGEGLIQCREDLKQHYNGRQLMVLDYSVYQGEEYICDAIPARKGAKAGDLSVADGEERFGNHIVRREVMPLDDCPLRVLDLVSMEDNPRELLERLPIEDILALHSKGPNDKLGESEEILETYDAFMDEDLAEDIASIVKSRRDEPYLQPAIGTPTDVIYYYYDYGDGWKIRITGSEDACDLVESGRVSQQELDEAIAKIYKTYRPVCIAADGLPLVDDVGGIGGYIAFLRSIHPTEENLFWGKDNLPENGPYEDKQNSLIWAKSLGWKDKVNVKRLL